jgi:hypothetical protein
MAPIVTLCAKTSMASLPVIATLQRAFGINADVVEVTAQGNEFETCDAPWIRRE